MVTANKQFQNLSETSFSMFYYYWFPFAFTIKKRKMMKIQQESRTLKCQNITIFN